MDVASVGDVLLSFLKKLVIQFVFTVAAFILLVSALIIQMKFDELAEELEKVQLEDLASPPPEPPPSSEEAALIMSSSTALEHEWDTFWGRRIPLLL